MKKLLTILSTLVLLLPLTASASIAVPWLATSTDAGYIQPNPVNGNNPFLKILSISTSTFQNGINLTTGCFAIGGVCISGSGGGSGTVTNIATTYPILGGPITTTGTLSLAFGTTTANSWSALQTFAAGISSAGITNSSLGAGTVNSTSVGLQYVTATSTPTVTAPIAYSGTLGSFIGGVSGAFSCITATGSVAGCLSAADWTTFNNKQPAGNYITALTGDVTASGPGSVAATLATVNGNVGSFTNANITVNAKGLITAASNGASGSGGAIGTSTPLVNGQVDFSTSANTIANDSTFLFDSTLKKLTVTNASTTNLSIGSLSGTLNANSGSVYASATTTLAGTGVISISNAPAVFGGTPAVTSLTGGSNGNILTWLSGIPTWLASSSLAIALSDTTGTLQVARGGTGQTSFTSSQLIYGNGTNGLSSTATTSVSCSGTVSCTSFAAIGASPITITGGAGGNVISTTSPISVGNLAYFTGVTPTSLGGVATGTVSNGTGISVTAGQSVIGSGLTITNTSPLSGLTTSFPLSFSNPTLSWIGLATTSQPASSNILVSDGVKGIYGAATTTASCSGTVSCATHTIIGTSPITITGAASSGNVSTSTNETAGNLAYWTSNSATPALLGKVSTTTLGFSGPFIGVGTLGALVGGSNSTITWTGLATTSQPSSSNLLTSNGSAGVYGTATSTLTASGPLTGSFTQIGSGGSLGCQTASGSQAGCLSSTDWTTFNNKGSGTVTSITLGGGLDGVSPITTTGTITAQIGTSTVPSLGGIATWTGIGTPSTLGTVATSTATCTSASGISCTSFSFVGTGGSTLALSAIPNSSLANSTISGISLGGTLNSLSHGSTLTGTSYNGSASVSNWDIDLTHANTWTGLQQFNANASTTGLTVSGSSFLSTASGGVNIGTTTSFGKALFVEGATSGGVAVIQRDFTSAPTNSFIGTYDVRLNEIGGLADGTGPAQTFGVEASGGAENIQADIGSFRDGADNTGGFAIRPYLAGVAQQVFTIRGNGNVGIGSSTPFSTLSVNAAAQTNPYFAIGSSSAPVFSISPAASAQLAVATGTPLGTNALTVNGGVYLHSLATGAGAGSVCATADGQILYNSGAACTISSKRFKTDIATITPEVALSTIEALTPVTFKYKNGYVDNGKATWEGFIAEQVATVDTNLVQYDASGTPYSVYYQNITSKLVGAVQAIVSHQDKQDKEIAELQQEVNELKNHQQTSRCVIP